MPRRRRQQVPFPLPAWNPGDEVEIVASGMRAVCIHPVELDFVIWNVELCTLAGHRMNRFAHVPARELRVWDPTVARYGRTDHVPG